MRRLTTLFAVVLPLVLAGHAAAKEVVSARVCGPADCRTVKDREAVIAVSEGGPPTGPPAEATGYFEVRVTVAAERGGRETFAMAAVPTAGLIRGGDAEQGYTWMPISRAAVLEYRELTRGLVPFPAASLEGLGAPKVRVDEVILSPEDPQPAGDRPSWPWFAAGGAVVLLVIGALTAGPWRRPRPEGPSPA